MHDQRVEGITAEEIKFLNTGYSVSESEEQSLESVCFSLITRVKLCL